MGMCKLKDPGALSYLHNGYAHLLFLACTSVSDLCVHILFPLGERQAGGMDQAKRYNFFHIQKGV